MSDSGQWPSLSWSEWSETCNTLHMWTQIVGKVKLELAPFLNELWEVAFHPTARGLTTGIIPTGIRVLQVDFDFPGRRLVIATSDPEVRTMELAPRSVSDFYREFMAHLDSLDIEVTISSTPVEVPDPIPFEQDQAHASYDADAVIRWWRIVLQTARILDQYRSPFVGKSSPVLFYWGSFDLNVTRYAGRPAPPMHGVPRFFQIAEDEENVSCGFWPGNANVSGVTLGQPAFYSYTAPAPPGFQEAAVRPNEGHFDERLGEFVLLYDDARHAPSPERVILDFFQSTYEAGATLAGWDRSRLERMPPEMRRRRARTSSDRRTEA